VPTLAHPYEIGQIQDHSKGMPNQDDCMQAKSSLRACSMTEQYHPYRMIHKHYLMTSQRKARAHSLISQHSTRLSIDLLLAQKNELPFHSLQYSSIQWLIQQA